MLKVSNIQPREIGVLQLCFHPYCTLMQVWLKFYHHNVKFVSSEQLRLLSAKEKTLSIAYNH